MCVYYYVCCVSMWKCGLEIQSPLITHQSSPLPFAIYHSPLPAHLCLLIFLFPYLGKVKDPNQSKQPIPIQYWFPPFHPQTWLFQSPMTIPWPVIPQSIVDRDRRPSWKGQVVIKEKKERKSVNPLLSFLSSFSSLFIRQTELLFLSPSCCAGMLLHSGSFTLDTPGLVPFPWTSLSFTLLSIPGSDVMRQTASYLLLHYMASLYKSTINQSMSIPLLFLSFQDDAWKMTRPDRNCACSCFLFCLCLLPLMGSSLPPSLTRGIPSSNLNGSPLILFAFCATCCTSALAWRQRTLMALTVNQSPRLRNN